MKPTSGSTSCWMSASRMARIKHRGNDDPLEDQGRRHRRRPRWTPSPACSERAGSRPSRTPWSGDRVDDGAQPARPEEERGSESRTNDQDGSSRLPPLLHLTRSRTMPKPESRPARHEENRDVGQPQPGHASIPPRRSRRRRRASPRGTRASPAGPTRARPGTTSRTSMAPEDEQLQRRPVEDHAERRPAVVEHHDLVDHGQLQVGVRVVERDAAVLGQQRRRTVQPRPGPAWAPACPQAVPMPGAEHAGQRQRAAELARATSRPRKNAGSARHAKVTSRAAPIPSNAEPVSRAAAAVKNRPRPSRYASRTRSPAKCTGAAHAAERHEERRAQRRRQGRPPARRGTPRSWSG